MGKWVLYHASPGGVGEGSGSMGGPVLQASRDSSNPQREDKEG